MAVIVVILAGGLSGGVGSHIRYKPYLYYMSEFRFHGSRDVVMV